MEAVKALEQPGAWVVIGIVLGFLLFIAGTLQVYWTWEKLTRDLVRREISCYRRRLRNVERQLGIEGEDENERDGC